GTMTKPLHAGRAAQSGVIAARLADRGFTASPDALEHRTGYLSALSPSGKPSLEERDHQLGRVWRMEALGVNIKRYPVCYSTHRAIDAILDVVERRDLKPGDVREIRVGAGAPELLMLRNHQPKTGLEAKFSMEFAMASALVARSVGLAELSDEFVRRQDVIDAMAKVTSTAIHDSIAGMPDSEPDTVEVELVSGEVLHTDPVKFARGGWQNPLSPADLKQKFMDCVGGALSGRPADAMFARLAGMRQAANLRDLDLTTPVTADRRSA
ncbi:MAG: MmgE/PrpD family protein, partial [Paracoccaceae bacterium]